ncbi:MAG: sodium:solute symporter family protein [Promethearchaeota archaeon]
MSHEWIFWSVIGAYLAFLAIAGIRAKGKTHNYEDFMVAGRKIGPLLLGLSFGVTYFSAVMIVGGGEFSYIWGLASVWIGVLNCLVGVFIAFIFFGKRTMRMSEITRSLTASELLGKRYQSETLRKWTALITILFETVYLVSIYMGLSVMLTYAMPSVDPNLSYTIAVILCGVITIIYLNVGGAHGAIATDVVESIIMLSGVASIFIAGLVAVGGIDGLVTTLQAIGQESYNNPDALTRVLPGISPVGFISYILVTSFGVWGMPQMITRYFTTKKKKSLRWGLLISVSWALLVSIFSWWNGAIGRAYYYQYKFAQGFIPGTSFESIVPALMRDVLPLALAALLFAAVTAASLTTGEKVIMVASSSFARDFYQTHYKVDDQKTWRMTQIMNTVVVVVGIILALLKPDAVLALCMFAWSALAATTLVPYVFGLFWKGGTKKAALWTGVIALIIALTWKMGMRGFCSPAQGCKWGDIFPFIPDSFRLLSFKIGSLTVVLKDIHEFIVSQVVAIIIFPIISLLTKKDLDNDYVNDLFSKVMGKKTRIKKAE